ncbi:DUF342 domain-containing protein [Crenobacter intestini]|uniref:DUF342 domain-containing protein n=1 Tax=Crenobacter intestini TaxID=2563443 RepID=A0A4T0UMC9_9NEIS|nr:DUF342 domain-containing protein [Crenobacter intestini]TIC79591.1 DUF342 domain-containing protein [Crenobacter intestini]
MKKQRGAVSLLAIVTVLALAALVVLYGARHVVLEHFNAQAQQRYHVALGNAEEGLALASKALELDGSRPDSPEPTRYTLRYQENEDQLRVISTGFSDNSTVSVQRTFVRDTATPPPPSSSNAMQINHDLNLSGSIKIKGGKDAKISVDGDVTLNGSIQGVDTLLATGDITIGGNQTVNVLGANGNIYLRNGEYQRVSTLGNLTTVDSARIGVALARGNASVGGRHIDQLQAIGEVNVTGGASSLGSLEAQGSVTSRTSGTISTLKTERNLTVEGWGGVMNAEVGGKASYNQNNSSIKVRLEPGLKVPITPPTPVTLQRVRVDANDYERLAHYHFSRDTAGKILVRVRSVHGIPDGDYRVGKNANNHENYLCRTVRSDGRCDSPTVGRLCQGFSDWNRCLEVDSKGNWVLNGESLAPGLAWFDGNLQAGNGTYYNSFFASGDILNKDRHLVYALNYIGYAGVCANAAYPGQYPTDYCNTHTQQLLGQTSGNIAYLAGHYQDSRYIGGNITLGSSNTVHGNVMAGNRLNSGGSTVIKGYVTVASQGAASSNNWGGSTTIDLTNLPDSFKPGQPGEGEQPEGGGSNSAAYRALPGSWIDGGGEP